METSLKKSKAKLLKSKALIDNENTIHKHVDSAKYSAGYHPDLQNLIQRAFAEAWDDQFLDTTPFVPVTNKLSLHGGSLALDFPSSHNAESD